MRRRCALPKRATARDLLDDFAVLTGATVVTRELGRTLEQFQPADLGRAKRVRVDSETTTVIEGGGSSSEIRERLAQLDKALAASDSEYERGALRQRIARVSGGIAVIRVGAPTELELTERRGRFDDALAARVRR